jgi:hypothetical protein
MTWRALSITFYVRGPSGSRRPGVHAALFAAVGAQAGRRAEDGGAAAEGGVGSGAGRSRDVRRAVPVRRRGFTLVY